MVTPETIRAEGVGIHMAGKIQIRLAILAALAALAALLVPSGLALGSHDEPTDADFIDDQGVLRLQLNSSVNQFLWNDGATDHTQTLVATRCEVDTAPSNLVKLASNRKVGTFGNSLGVKSGGAQGVACSRVSSGESMTFETSGVIADYEIAEVQLDVEMKMGAEVQVQTFLDANSLETFTLRSGSSIVSGQGTEPSGQIATSTSGTPIANCRQPSDSGPDAGSLDNCRWVIKDIKPFDRIVFTALAGEYSIEGGGDGTPAAAAGFGSDSLFFLTDVETLTCGGSADFGDDTLGGGVTLACPEGFKIVRYRSSA
ncbi:MAG TPA: hypothetical protein VEB69_02215, partial [Acidimicrobiia bacterium]|nr:hypothetical protein [Acidimicrobiia bacterium]